MTLKLLELYKILNEWVAKYHPEEVEVDFNLKYHYNEKKKKNYLILHMHGTDLEYYSWYDDDIELEGFSLFDPESGYDDYGEVMNDYWDYINSESNTWGIDGA